MDNKVPILKKESWRGGLSDYEDKGIEGSFKFAKNLDIRKLKDTLSCNQALMDIGDLVTSSSLSPSASLSPSSSLSPSTSPSVSPSASASPTLGNTSPSSSRSPSASLSPSASRSPSASLSPSSSTSPSPSPSAGLTTVFADLILWFVPCSDGNTYGFGDTGKIYKINSEYSVSLAYNQGQKIKGAAEAVTSNGDIYLVWATNTELHRKKIPGNTSWNDVDQITPGTPDPGWPKTTLTSTDWHTMRQINGSLYIANGSSLALLGYDQSYTTSALDVIPGNLIKTIVERNSRHILGVYRSGYPNAGVNAAIDTELPLAQIGDDGELYYANMADFVYIKRFPGGGIVNPGGVTAEVDHIGFFEWDGQSLSYIDKQKIANLALWGVYNATSGKNGVYSYGRKNKNHPTTLNLDYELDVDEIGAVISTNGQTLISYRDGSDFGVKAVDPNNKAEGVFESLDFKVPPKTVETPTYWDFTELYFAPLPTGCSIKYYYRMNKAGDFIQAKTADGSTSFSVTGGEKAVFLIGDQGEVIERKIVLTPSGNTTPEVYREWVY